MKVKDAGQIRSSEIITTYGPGAIYNGKNGLSVMVLGLDFWPEFNFMFPYRYFGKLHFRY